MIETDSASSEILVPGSAAYKKARKHFLKSTRNRPVDDSFSWSPFRESEKKYKAKFPPPDLSEVLDLALLDESREEEVKDGVWKGTANLYNVYEIELEEEIEPDRSCNKGKKKAYCIPQIPGLVLLPGFLNQKSQRRLVKWSLSEHARGANQTNLDVHYEIPDEGIWNMHIQSRLGPKTMINPRKPEPDAIVAPPGPRQLISNTAANPENFKSLSDQPKPPTAPSPNIKPVFVSELVPKLRWANIGWFYHWGSKQYDFSRGKIDVEEPVKSICINIVRSIRWEKVFSHETNTDSGHSDWGNNEPDWHNWYLSYEPDAGIVNYYQYKDTLMGHVDRSEVCATSPLVSLSLGNAAVFLVGGSTRDAKPVPVLLRSGDAVVMAGPGCRRAYHGVPRILEGTLPSHFRSAPEYNEDWEEYFRYLRTTRINVNVRQVFPKGFNPVHQHSADREANHSLNSFSS